MIRHSRQRECIKKCLAGRFDHPTAETIYQDIKDEFPNISLGTVYRNLSLLAELGEIQKISTGSGPDRFDGRATAHYHFFCKECGCVLDMDFVAPEDLNVLASRNFPGRIDSHTIQFQGVCDKCLQNKQF